MKTQLSQRDWQRLSAYIDGQLPPQKQARLAARLEREPALQAALEDLRVMKQKLGELPKMRAPRNFTLTPEMVSERHRRVRSFNFMRLASALASLLLVLVFIGDNLSYGNLAMAPAPAMERSMDDAEVFAEMAEPEEEAAPMELYADEVDQAEAGEGLNAAESDKVGEDMVGATEKQAESEEMALEENRETTEGVVADIPQREPVSIRPVIILEVLLVLSAVITGLLAFRLRRR